MLKNKNPKRVVVLFDTGTKIHTPAKGKGAYNRAKEKNNLKKEERYATSGI